MAQPDFPNRKCRFGHFGLEGGGGGRGGGCRSMVVGRSNVSLPGSHWALGVRGTVAGHRLGALERGRRGYPPLAMHPLGGGGGWPFLDVFVRFWRGGLHLPMRSMSGQQVRTGGVTGKQPILPTRPLNSGGGGWG